MNKKIPSAKKQAFREQLQREAMESCPAFSEALHRQILSAVTRHGAEEAVRARVASRAVRWPTLVAALAAACALAVVMVGWPMLERKGPPGTPAENVVIANNAPVDDTLSPSVSIVDIAAFDALTDDTANNLDQLIVFTTVAPRSALKHDIRLAAEVLIERLPVNVELLAGP